MAPAEILRLFLRRVCCLCGGTAGSGGLCEWCGLRLYPATGIRTAAGAEVRSAYLHVGSGGGLVRRIKFEGVRSAAGVAAALMARRLDRWIRRADLLVPMPLSARRRRERGFNQAGLLAEGVSRRLDVPVERGLSREHRPSQVGLDRRGRRANVRGAYAPLRGFRPGGTVCLVDDVITTGSSLAEAVEVVRDCGAEGVMAATLTYRSPASL